MSKTGLTKPESQKQEVKQGVTESPQSHKPGVAGPFDLAAQRETTLGKRARGLRKSMVQSPEGHTSQKSFFAFYIARKSIKTHWPMCI